MNFHIANEQGMPAPFLLGNSSYWYWPGPAVKVKEKLLLSYLKLQPVDFGLGFEAIGGVAFLVDNHSLPADQWVLKPLALPFLPDFIRFGTGALLVENNQLYAFLVTEPGSHDVYLARWPLSSVVAGNLSGAQWYQPGLGWVSDSANINPILESVQTECSVHRDIESGLLQLISVDGFGGTNVVMRTASQPEGPWSSMQFLARPEESNRSNVIVYSAKAHPALHGAKTPISYCSNSLDSAELLRDMSLYFPRFVRQKSLDESGL